MSTLILGTLSAIFFLSGMQMIEAQLKAQRSLATQSELDALKTQISFLLRNPADCTSLFSGKTFSTTQGASIDELTIMYPSQPTNILAKPGWKMEGQSQISEVSLVDFIAQTDNVHYQANLRFRLQQKSGSTTSKNIPLLFATQDAGSGNRRIASCVSDPMGVVAPPPQSSPTPSPPPGPKFDYICEQVHFDRPKKAGSEPSPGVYLKRKCPKVEQVITSCSAVEHPNGTRVCGTTGMSGRDTDGKAYCMTYGCTGSPNANDFWQVTINCCEIIQTY